MAPTATTEKTPVPLVDEGAADWDNERLAAAARTSLDEAIEYSWNELHEGHWYGELLSNVTITSEQVFLYTYLGIPISDSDKDKFTRYLLSEQSSDGSWLIAPDWPGDISSTVEAYLALRIMGLEQSHPALLQARAWILKTGGIPKVRIMTRFLLAKFGLFQWSSLPQMPAEFILLPPQAPINVYSIASWARSYIVPLMIIRHHKPLYALPNGKFQDNDFLDELWLDPSNKTVPYGHSRQETWNRGDYFALVCDFADTALHLAGGLKYNPLRPLARRRCIQWILDRQETAGDWAGIIPPMHVGVEALILEGYSLDSPEVQGGIAASERFAWEDKVGKRTQACVSPVWDTVLMVRGLCDAGVDLNDPRLRHATIWAKSRQILGPEGDCRVYKPDVGNGGFAFEYFNTWYPDVDDTAAAVLAFVKQSPESIDSMCVGRAVNFMIDMQNSDGGWAAFDHDCNKLWLNRIPFADLGNLCDPSTADVTGRILEALGLILKCAETEIIPPELADRIKRACDRGVPFLISLQETNGSFYGRWGVNYIYGTCHAVCGLSYFTETHPMARKSIAASAAWLRTVQNSDGGFGESLQSYRDPSAAGIGKSTASQTAWAVMSLLTDNQLDDPCLKRGVSYLLRNQTEHIEPGGATWPETAFTATGFPHHFYIQYMYYRHYFPLMALGRYVEEVTASKSKKIG